MLKKKFRLTKFSLANPRQIATPLFNIKFAKNNYDVSRFAFIVSKKIDPRATSRNRMKRKVRACIEQMFDRIEGGYDFIFYPNKKTESAESTEIMTMLEGAFRKQNLLIK